MYGIVWLVTEVHIASHTFLCINLFRNYIQIIIIRMRVENRTLSHTHTHTHSQSMAARRLCSKYFPKWLETYSMNCVPFLPTVPTGTVKRNLYVYASLPHFISGKRIWIYLSWCWLQSAKPHTVWLQILRCSVHPFECNACCACLILCGVLLWHSGIHSATE